MKKSIMIGFLFTHATVAMASENQNFAADLVANRAKSGHTIVNGAANISITSLDLSYVDLVRGVSGRGEITILDGSNGPITTINVVTRLERPVTVWRDPDFANQVVEINPIIRDQASHQQGLTPFGAIILSREVQPIEVNAYTKITGLTIRDGSDRRR